MATNEESIQTANFNDWIGHGERLSDLTVFSISASREQATVAINGIIGKDLVNAETGIIARIYTNQRNKILSIAALEKSESNGFNAKQHFAVATRIDKAWKYASLVKTRDDKEGDKNIVSVKRFASPILLDEDPAIAYITVKESVEHGYRVYSLELREIKKARREGGTL